MKDISNIEGGKFAKGELTPLKTGYISKVKAHFMLS